MFGQFKHLFGRRKPIHEQYPEIINWSIGDEVYIWFKYGKAEWNDYWKVVNILENGIVVQKMYDEDINEYFLKFKDREFSYQINVYGNIHYIDENVRVTKVKHKKLLKQHKRNSASKVDTQYYELIQGIREAMNFLEENNNEC